MDATFNPEGPTKDNGNFCGLPFTYESASAILIPACWDVTASFHKGTAEAPPEILKASAQLDLADVKIPRAWELGLFMDGTGEEDLEENERIGKKATDAANLLEEGKDANALLKEVNASCSGFLDRLQSKASRAISAGKIPGIIGGDHSCALAGIRALADSVNVFGILQIDAHADLRTSYQGFTYSHASVMHHAAQLEQVSRIVQVGVRDFSPAERETTIRSDGRIVPFYHHDIRNWMYSGGAYNRLVDQMIERLPEQVYVSVDIDGLDPKLCPHTGTPVPGGLEFQELIFLLEMVVKSGRSIIGFDVCEVGVGDWDANVAARLLYKLGNLAIRSGQF